MIYLASPYSHEEKFIEEQRYEDIKKVTFDLVRRSFVVFSPIVYCHPIKKHYNLEGDYKTWEFINEGFIKISYTFLILQLEGWDKSEGIRKETQYAKLISIPIRYSTWEEILGNDWTIGRARREP